MSTKKIIQKSAYKDDEIEIELPFYSYVQEKENEIHVKIDENYFSQIVFTNTGKCEFIRFKHHDNISFFWFNNKTTEFGWKTALEYLKLSMDKFINH